jgi:hypothetical protein
MQADQMPAGQSVDAALRQALRADTDGDLRDHVIDLAVTAWRMSCHPDAAAATFRGLADALRDAVLPDAGAVEGGPVGAGVAEAAAHDGADRDEAPRLTADWLTQTRDKVHELSEGRLFVPDTDPATLWRQLHLRTLFLPEEQRRGVLKLLHPAPNDADPAFGPDPDNEGQSESGYLVPPFAAVGETGLTWAEAEAHPVITKALADWPDELMQARVTLSSVLGLAWTVLANGPFAAGGLPGEILDPVLASLSRHEFLGWWLGPLEKLADPRLGPRQRVDWLRELDGRLRSVFPLPVPSPHSMWAKRLEISLDLLRTAALTAAADAEVELVRAGTKYEDERRCRYAPDGNIAIRPFDRSELSQVLWPLRAHVLLPATEGSGELVRPGQVIYGSPRGQSYPAQAVPDAP